MAKQININLSSDFDDYGIHLNFDDYGVLLYYAYTIDNIKSLQLYNSTINEYTYRTNNNILLENLTELDYGSHSTNEELPLVIDFIENNLIPNLEGLPSDLDLVESWNIDGDLDVFFYNQGSFFQNFLIDNIDTEGFTPPYLIEILYRFGELFKRVISENSTYFIRIE